MTPLLHDISDLQAAVRYENTGNNLAVLIKAVQSLLDSGHDPHKADTEGNTAFNAAAALNAPVCGRLLTLSWLERAMAGQKPGLNDPSGAHGSTLAQYMAKWLEDAEFEAILEKAMAAGLRIDIPNASGWTPLIAAGAMGRVVVVEALVKRYSHIALCRQTTYEYTAVYNGCTVNYGTSLNAFEVMQERLFQDEEMSETLAENIWSCMETVAAAIASYKSRS